MVPLLILVAAAQAQNPFAPPRAFLHYAPDRTCDLLNVSVDLDVDYAGKTIAGTVVNTMAPLRGGITKVILQAGTSIEIKRVSVDGKPSPFTREGRNLTVDTPGARKGVPMAISIQYSSANSQGRSFGFGGGGWHWIRTQNHVGFWTQGESESNSEWCPTWDYPNDLATSETKTTVPADWDVIGNGVLVSNVLSPDKKRRTFDWKMNLPHATYLLSLCGGPFDIKRDKWEGVDLWYVVPKGEGRYIDDSFGDTKDMLSFYSSAVGYKYPWPKYAQDAMYDFGGGMENVSATTLGAGSLTEKREGFRRMASLNSHELGHQWFGDTVTCKDWGDIWLNESFATFMQDIYFEHSRGKNAYDYEMDDNMRGYFGEARRYKHPLSTKMYPNADSMFDSHTYPKGGAILHTLRRFLGDEAFFGGLKRYLNTWQHTPVESAQLRRAMTETSGINVEPFWAQWIEKPGHPVLDYTWRNEGSKTFVTVKQTQDTSDGTPVYDIQTKLAFLHADAGGRQEIESVPIHLSKAEETFEISAKSGPPMSVLLDPDHDFLREIPNLHWFADELPLILAMAPNCTDRYEAMKRLLDGSPSEATIQIVAAQVRNDNGQFPVFRSVNVLGNLAKPELRGLWLDQLKHPDYDRRAEAVSALAKLPQDPATVQRLRAMINDQEAITAVVNAINALAAWDKKANEDVIKKALTIPSRNDRIKRAAQRALE